MEIENGLIKDIFDQWYRGIRSAQLSHSVASIYYLKLHRLVGFLVIGITSIVGLLTFYTPQGSYSDEISLVKSTLSVLAVVVASIQTFFNYAELSQRHGKFSTRYRILRKELDQFFLEAGLSKNDTEFMNEFRKKWDAIDEEAPTLSEAFINKTNRIFKKTPSYENFTEYVERKLGKLQ